MREVYQILSKVKTKDNIELKAIFEKLDLYIKVYISISNPAQIPESSDKIKDLHLQLNEAISQKDDLISQLKLVIDKQKLTTGDGLSSRNGNPNSANSANSTNLTNSPNSSNQNNSNSQVSVTGVPSSNVISSLKQAAKKPPPPLKIIAPAGGTTADIPLGVVEKAKIVAAAAASGPNPAPKLDAVFIFAADKKWHDEDDAYKNSVKTNSNVKI